MAYTTLPGVRVTVADGFYATNDATVNGLADRVLIVARAADGTNASVLKDPSRIWKGESEVIDAFGRGSDVHIAFNAAVKGGAGNIFISATDFSPNVGAGIPDDIVVAGDTLDDLTEDEYELYRALENASLANPSMIVAYGYAANKRLDLGATERLAYFAKIVAQRCEDLTLEVGPCYGIMSMTTFEEFYQDANGTGYSGTYPVPAADVKTFIDWMLGSTAPTAGTVKPHSIKDVVDSVETVGNDTGLTKYLVLLLGDVQLNNQVPELGLGVSEYIPACAVVCGNIYRLSLEKAVTMEPLQNVVNLAFDMTPAQKIAIINKGVIPLGVSPRGLLVAVDGVTAAIPDAEGNSSVYNRLSSVRIVHEVIRGTRGELEPFIGTTATTARLNSIETKLRSYYMALKQNELVKEVRFEMRYSISTSTLTVVITVMPFGEIRDIEVTVDVQLQ